MCAYEYLMYLLLFSIENWKQPVIHCLFCWVFLFRNSLPPWPGSGPGCPGWCRPPTGVPPSAGQRKSKTFREPEEELLELGIINALKPKPGFLKRKPNDGLLELVSIPNQKRNHLSIWLKSKTQCWQTVQIIIIVFYPHWYIVKENLTWTETIVDWDLKCSHDGREQLDVNRSHAEGGRLSEADAESSNVAGKEFGQEHVRDRHAAQGLGSQDGHHDDQGDPT